MVMFCFPDTKSFESQFAQRRDSGFYTFREFHTFIRKLAGRALLPRHVPDILDWKSLGDLQGQNWRQLSNRDFLSRLKLKENLDAACHARVRRIYSEKQLTPEETETAAEALRDDFATKARGYLVHLLKVFLADISLNAGIVRGLGSFDPIALLSLPLEQATYCFSALYRSFSLRGWLENSPETDARDEYIDFVEFFRQANSGVKDTPEVFTDMVAFLIGMPELKLRKHLFYIFQLSCLCLTSKLPELPAIKFSGVDCNDPRSRLFDVIMPAQSYLANVANSVAVCTTEASLGTFKDLEFRFSIGNVPGDPWSHVDSFGKANLHKTLIAVYKALSKSVRPDIESASNSSSKEGGKQRKLSPGKGKKVGFRASGETEAAKSSDANAPGTSKS